MSTNLGTSRLDSPVRTTHTRQWTCIHAAPYACGMPKSPRPERQHTDKRIPELVSLTEASAILGIYRTLVHRMADDGRIPGAQVGETGTWVFRKAVIERLRDQRAGDLTSGS